MQKPHIIDLISRLKLQKQKKYYKPLLILLLGDKYYKKLEEYLPPPIENGELLSYDGMTVIRSQYDFELRVLVD